MASNAFGYKTHSIVGSVDTINTDITFYSPDELSKILQLTKVTKDTVIKATNKYINKFRQENNSRLVNFFSEVQRKLIQSLEPDNNRSIVKKKDSTSEQHNNTEEQLNDWSQNQNQMQESEDAIIYPLGTTDRKQKVDIYDDHHNVMSQEKLAVQHNPSIVQGQINPNLKNTITRIVNIDSKYRLSAVPSVKNKKFRDIINHHTSAWSGTDYTLDFNDPLRKVLSLRLYSLQIPYSWYTIDTAYGTSCFVLKQLTSSTGNIVNGVSGVAMMENIITRFVAVDGFNIVTTDQSGKVVNFNGEVISGLTNTNNMGFFFINDTGDIIDPNGVRVKTITGKDMKVLVNSKNYVKTSNPPDITVNSVNRILDVNGFPTRFLKKDFSEPSSIGTLLTNINGSISSNLYFTLDKYGNTVTHIYIDGNGDKHYEHSPKIIFDKNKIILNVDSTGDVSTLNANGTVKYDSSNTGIDLDNDILFNSTNSFKNSATLHDVVVDNGNYTPTELVTEINNKLKESIASNNIITTEIDYYDDSISSITVQLIDRKIVVGGTYFDGTNKKMVVCRYNTNGILDTTFNSTGKQLITIDINNEELTSITCLHYDSKIIFGGTSINDVTKTKDFVIGRINTNGTLDSAFGADKTGSTIFSFGDRTKTGEGDDILTGIIYENSNKTDPGDNSVTFDIYACGYSYNTITNKYDFVVVKISKNGALTTTFGKGGKKRFNIGTDDDILTCMVLSGDEDVNLVLGGYSYNATSTKYECILVRTDNTGALDNTFGTAGIFKFSFNSGTVDSIMRCMTKFDGEFKATTLTGANTTNSIANGTYVTISYSATGSGVGATISQVTIDGTSALTSFTIDSGGLEYVAGNTLTITVDGTEFIPYTIESGDLTGTVLNIGTITPGTALTVGSGTSLTTGTYTHAIFSVISTTGEGINASINKIVIAGTVPTITMNLGGINYLTGNTITININNVNLDLYTILSSDITRYYIVGGYVFNSTSETYDFALARILENGSMDNAFGTAGIKIIAVNVYHNFLTAISIDINENIIAGGYTYNGNTYDFTVIRMNQVGVMDITFGKNENGVVTTTIDNTDLIISGISPNLDGKITVVGSATKNSNSDFALTRYTINGVEDSTYVNKNNEKTYATMTYNAKNGKSSIVTYNKFYSVLFYKQNEPFCTPKCGQGPRANNNLGWICGFRDQEYTSLDTTTTTTNTFSFTGEAIVDTFGTRYFLLSIDDYNSNQINKAIVSIENVEKKADIPSYYSSDLTPNPTCDTTNSLYSVPQYLQGRPAQITQAQQYTLNEILKNRKETSNNVLISPSNSNVFAVIPLKKSGITPGDALIEFSGPIQINERNYFGPVDIDKMRVQLLDDKGNVVNLNGMDWSFSIVTEHLYQY